MYNLRILVNGRPIPVYNGRDGKKWVEARENTKFEVKVENNSYNRILAVTSVDGLNVINAKHEDPMEAPGYILSRNGSISIPGWLIDNDNVREFLFTQDRNSYAKKIGADVSNVGVIGVAIVSEQPAWTYTVASTGSWSNGNLYYPPGVRGIQPSWTGDDIGASNVFMSISSDQASVTNFSAQVESSSMAVGSGEVQEFSTVESSFTRDKVETVLTVYYDSRENLIKNGIIVENGPVPFPINSKYCPDV